MVAYDTGNIFAKIIRGEIPAEKIYEDDTVLAIRDISPAAPAHVLVMPKGHYISFDDFVVKASAEIVQKFFKTVQKIADKELDLQETGYRLIMNHGVNASQTVPHFHVHILGGKPLGGLLGTDRHAR